MLEKRELKHRLTVYVVAFGFLVGLALCLATDLNHSHHGSESPSAETHIAQACGTSVVPYEDQLASNSLPLILSLRTELNTFYEGVLLSPPFPPPRG
ncbi:MAG: hypothetical protein ACE5HC_15155 [Candidatus Binatia bacterium]